MNPPKPRDRNHAGRQLEAEDLAQRAHQLVEIADVVLYVGQFDGNNRPATLAAIVTEKGSRDVNLSVFTAGPMVQRYNIAFDMLHGPTSWHFKHAPAPLAQFQRCVACVEGIHRKEGAQFVARVQAGMSRLEK